MAHIKLYSSSVSVKAKILLWYTQALKVELLQVVKKVKNIKVIAPKIQDYKSLIFLLKRTSNYIKCPFITKQINKLSNHSNRSSFFYSRPHGMGYSRNLYLLVLSITIGFIVLRILESFLLKNSNSPNKNNETKKIENKITIEEKNKKTSIGKRLVTARNFLTRIYSKINNKLKKLLRVNGNNSGGDDNDPNDDFFFLFRLVIYLACIKYMLRYLIDLGVFLGFLDFSKFLKFLMTGDLKQWEDLLYDYYMYKYRYEFLFGFPSALHSHLREVAIENYFSELGLRPELNQIVSAIAYYLNCELAIATEIKLKVLYSKAAKELTKLLTPDDLVFIEYASIFYKKKSVSYLVARCKSLLKLAFRKSTISTFNNLRVFIFFYFRLIAEKVMELKGNK